MRRTAADRWGEHTVQRKENPGSSASPVPNTSKSSLRPSPLGDVLRTVYDDALREEVPQEMLDLLKKLS